MKKIKILSLLFLTLAVKPLFSCVCDELRMLDGEVCSAYEWIFEGKVLNGSCENEDGTTIKVLQSFKGDQAEIETILVDCQSNCTPEFLPGDIWLFFLDRNNSLQAVFDLCGHSRKKIKASEVDYQQEIRGSSYETDLSFLKERFGSKEKANPNDLKPRKYEKVDPSLLPWFFGISAIAMLLGFLLFNVLSKKKK